MPQTYTYDYPRPAVTVDVALVTREAKEPRRVPLRERMARDRRFWERVVEILDPHRGCGIFHAPRAASTG